MRSVCRIFQIPLWSRLIFQNHFNQGYSTVSWHIHTGADRHTRCSKTWINWVVLWTKHGVNNTKIWRIMNENGSYMRRDGQLKIEEIGFIIQFGTWLENSSFIRSFYFFSFFLLFQFLILQCQKWMYSWRFSSKQVFGVHAKFIELVMKIHHDKNAGSVSLLSSV